MIRLILLLATLTFQILGMHNYHNLPTIGQDQRAQARAGNQADEKKRIAYQVAEEQELSETDTDTNKKIPKPIAKDDDAFAATGLAAVTQYIIKEYGISTTPFFTAVHSKKIIPTSRMIKMLLFKGRFLIYRAIGNNTTIFVRDLETDEIKELSGHEDLIGNFFILPNDLLVTSSQLKVRVWDPITGKLLKTIDVGARQYTMPLNNRIATIFGNTAHIWDPISGDPIDTIQITHEDAIIHSLVALSEETIKYGRGDKVYAILSGKDHATRTPKTINEYVILDSTTGNIIKIYNPYTKEYVKELSLDEHYEPNRVFCNNMLAIRNKDGKIVIWDAVKQETTIDSVVRSVKHKLSDNACYPIALFPDKKLLLSKRLPAEYFGDVYICDPIDNHMLRIQNEVWPRNMLPQISRSGDTIVIYSETLDKEVLYVFRQHQAAVAELFNLSTEQLVSLKNIIQEIDTTYCTSDASTKKPRRITTDLLARCNALPKAIQECLAENYHIVLNVSGESSAGCCTIL